MRTVMRMILTCALLACAPAAMAAQNRCGWLQNPTPGNYWLDDADGSWTILTQGSDIEPDGIDLLPDISEGDYVRTNGNYGYACACLNVETDSTDGRITEILSFRQLQLSKCRKDPNLNPPQ